MEKKKFLVMSVLTLLTLTSAGRGSDICSRTNTLYGTVILYGFETVEGKTIVRPKYTYASQFSDGIALVAESKASYNDVAYFINRKGKSVFPHIRGSRSEIDGFGKGQLASIKQGGKWGCIDKTGTFVIPAQFENKISFREGLSAAKFGNKYGFIDEAGKTVIQARFEDVGFFAEDLAAVKIDGKFGFIDKSGKTIIPPRFEDAGFFAEDLAAVKIDGKFGFIDKSGQTVIQPQFKYADAFSGGFAVIQSDEGDGLIDRAGKIVLTPEYYSVDNWMDRLGIAIVGLGPSTYISYGWIDKTGRFLVDFNNMYSKVKVNSLFPLIRVTHTDESEKVLDTAGKLVKSANGGYFSQEDEPQEGIFITRKKIPCRIY